MGIKDWIKSKAEKKKEEDELKVQKAKEEEEWKAKIKKEALDEAREEIKNELKQKYVAEEKERLKAGKSNFMAKLGKEFSGVGDKFKNSEFGSNEKVGMSNEMSGLDFRGKLEREFGSNKSTPSFKSGDEISGLMGVKRSDEVINKSKVDMMLGKSIDTSNPQNKIGKLDFKSSVDRATPKFKKYKVVDVKEDKD
jgi:hypothetical protein